jgi:hypothetical protein
MKAFRSVVSSFCRAFHLGLFWRHGPDGRVLLAAVADGLMASGSRCACQAATRSENGRSMKRISFPLKSGRRVFFLIVSSLRPSFRSAKCLA